jgi:hypothetical protein
MIFKLKNLFLLFIFINVSLTIITEKQKKEDDNNDKNLEDKSSISDNFVLLSSEGEMKEKESSKGLLKF